MPMEAPPHEPPATKSGKADCASYRRPRPGQRLDQSVEEASNESTKVGGEGRFEAGSQSAPGAAGPGGGGAASQKERPAVMEPKEGGEREEQKAGKIERWRRSGSSELFITGPSGEGARRPIGLS
jgi:hypothetical protein